MKLLFLSQGTKKESQPGFDEAFLKLKTDGRLLAYDNIPYFGFAAEHGWPAFFDEVVMRAKAQESTLVFFQYFHSREIQDPSACINALRALPSKPVVVVSAGDPFSADWMAPHYPVAFRTAARLADMTFTTQMGAAALKMKRWGVRNIVLLPHAHCQVRFPESIPNLSVTDPEFDVIFIGSFLASRNVASHYYYACRQRCKMVRLLEKRFGKKFGLFGFGWEGSGSWQGPVPYVDQISVCRRGRLVFGGAPHSLCDYYMSDRPFFAIASGIPFIDMHVPNTEKIFRDGEHWHLCHDEDELINAIDRLVIDDRVRTEGAVSKRIQYIFERHTQYQRMRFLVETANRFWAARQIGDAAPRPVFDFFLPEVDIKNAEKSALCNWTG